MWNLFFACVTVFFGVMLLTPPIGAVAWKIGAVDVPKDARRMHKESVPRSGGVAIFLALLAGCVGFCTMDPFLLRILIGATLLTMIGLLDDIYSIRPLGKLLAQIGAAVIGVYGASLGVVLWSSFWVVAVTNAHNFIDGIDGLFAGCASVESIVLAGLLFLFGQESLALPCVLIFVACLAFRSFNSHPAMIFAGDCGSGTVGYLLGMLSLPLFWEMRWEAGWLSPLFLFAYPLTDLFTSVVRRILRGNSPFHADRGHIHHRICATGIGQIACGRILIFLSALGALVAAFLSTGGDLIAASLSCVVAAVFLIEIRTLFYCI